MATALGPFGIARTFGAEVPAKDPGSPAGEFPITAMGGMRRRRFGGVILRLLPFLIAWTGYGEV